MENKIAEYIRKIVGEAGYDSFPAEVASVEENTCTVKRLDSDAEYTNIVLNADINDNSGLVITPKVGSVVIVTMRDELNGFISIFSEIEKVHFVDVNGFECIIEKGSISLKNKTESLQKILLDFIAEVAKIIVVQGTSPNVPALQMISQRVQNLLK
jgi:hypothetical protein